MQKITTTHELRAAILLLEIKQCNEGVLLKEQVKATYESLKSVNIIKNIFKELISSSDIKENILNTTLGLAAGYLTKKAAVGSTHNPIKQLLGSLLQMGVSSVVSKNGDGIRSMAANLINSFFNKKERTT